MKIISVINYKGGVGKTTLTANLGAELAWRGKKVLLIDMDAQASLTFSFITPSEWQSTYEKSDTIKSWFDDFMDGKSGSLSKLINTPHKVNDRVSLNSGQLDVIYSHLALINLDLDLATKLVGANIGQAKANFLKVHTRLKDGLTEIQNAKYDVVLIDCPPNFNIVTKTAIVASDHILVPTRPDELSTLGIDYLMRSIDQLTSDFNDYVKHGEQTTTQEIAPTVLGVIFTMIQEYSSAPIQAQQQFVNRVRKTSRLPTFESYMKRNDTIFADAPAYGSPVVLKAYNNASHQSVVDSLEAICDEFIRKAGI
ncbi:MULTISPECIES: ParA family protein [unclassified Yoonia]|uniref:ParA family protein n=1 Tax=unclassified Yoonia TaxID=2629118 RepID=UPI002AFEFA43|nr:MULTISPECIES: ParA family protein [unclassified Yoonia]